MTDSIVLVTQGGPTEAAPRCRQCGREHHPFDILCPQCRTILVAEATGEQLMQGERLARIRAHLSATPEKPAARPWPEVLKATLPVAATLIVAFGGWWITSTYNEAQLHVQRSQQAASRATAEANASLAYLQFLARAPAPTEDQRDQALMAVAGVLPPELSFNLAVKRLPQERSIVNLLLRVYGDQSWRYLSSFVEDKATAASVLQVLHDQNLLNRELDWLIGPTNDRPHRRLPALVSYFAFLQDLDHEVHPEIHKPAVRALVSTTLSRSDIDSATKGDVAAAAAFVFVTEPGYEPDWGFLEMAAASFWEPLDTGVGELPPEGSVRYDLFFQRFHIHHDGKSVPTPAVATASTALVTQLLAGPLERKSVDELARLLYSYCAYVPRDGPDPFSPYLTPGDCLRLVEAVADAVNTPERRKRLSEEMGSMTGHVLYRNVGRDKSTQRRYAEALLTWYEQYAVKGWGIPEFFHDVASDQPDLSRRIDAILGTVGQQQHGAGGAARRR